MALLLSSWIVWAFLTVREPCQGDPGAFVQHKNTDVEELHVHPGQDAQGLLAQTELRTFAHTLAA